MDFSFEEATLRLKQQLGVRLEKEVCAALEMTEAAWKMRKKRDNFPETELYALAAKRPKLAIDVEYVLTGITREARARLAANREAGEFAAAHSGSFRAGWEDCNNVMRVIQRALETDRAGFAELAELWPTIPSESKNAIVTLARCSSGQSATEKPAPGVQRIKKQTNISSTFGDAAKKITNDLK
ncbi:MAG: hypothetical protein LBJ59_11965 [Zoogloeaceae bacterium]|jgi:hypothetical protein|nr:hypothetical protein [Zoogloeaceae bacterium]